MIANNEDKTELSNKQVNKLFKSRKSKDRIFVSINFICLFFVFVSFFIVISIIIHKGVGAFYHTYAESEMGLIKLDSKLDSYYKYGTKSSISNDQIKEIDRLEQKGKIHIKFDPTIITASDSTYADKAGIKWSILGSIITVTIAIAIAIPFGICAGLYIEEFAKNKFIKSVIDISINNLASIPSVIYGVVALYVLIGTFMLPRSSLIVSALTLTLMAVPLIYVSTRAGLAALDPTLKQAGLGLGLSHTQVVLFVLLPSAFPRIMNGIIMSSARIFGEAAPLILVGSVAFIANKPESINDPIPLIPTQIYLWTQNIDSGFIEKSFGAIIILLLINLFVSIISNRITKT